MFYYNDHIGRWNFHFVNFSHRNHNVSTNVVNLFTKLYISVQLCEPTIERKKNFQKSREIRCYENSEIQLWLKNHVFWIKIGSR